MKSLKTLSVTAITTASYFIFAASTYAATIAPAPLEGSHSPIIGATTKVTINTVVAWVITAIGVFAVLAALLFLLWGAIKWIISGGDKEKVDAARKQIIAAIIGLVLVILSFVILNFIIQFFTGSDIFNLNLPSFKEALDANQ
jgi:hypothetical protein